MLARFNAVFDRIIQVAFILAAALLVFMVVTVIYEVVMRYFLNRPTTWVVEYNQYALLYVTFLAAAWLLRKGEHVKMDIVFNMLQPRTQAALVRITSVFGAISFLVVTGFSVWVTWDHFVRGVYFETILRTPYAPIAAVVPIGSFLLFMQFLRIIFRPAEKMER